MLKISGRTQNVIRTVRYAELTGGAAGIEILFALGARRGEPLVAPVVLLRDHVGKASVEFGLGLHKG